MTPPRAAGGPVKRPKPAGPAPRRAAARPASSSSTTTAQDRPYHMMKEVTTKPGFPQITALCGVVGRAWVHGDRADEIHSTGWPSDVTCPDCIKHPGVGKHPAHMEAAADGS